MVFLHVSAQLLHRFFTPRRATYIPSKCWCLRTCGSIANMRVNGFAGPPHPFQIASYIAFTLFIAGFHIFFQPALPPTYVRYLVLTIYDLIVIVVIFSAYQATVRNPVDPACHPQGIHGYTHETPLERERRRAQVFPGKEWCQYCADHVHPHSKHCRACDKCVDIFDHHCKWLNNCIGRVNYKAFFASITSVALLTLYQDGIAIWIIVKTAMDENSDVRLRLVDQFGTFSALAVWIVFAFYAVFLSIVALAVLKLMWFHFFLWRLNLTTYEWIMYQREIQKAKASGDPIPPLPTGRVLKRQELPASKVLTVAVTPITSYHGGSIGIGGGGGGGGGEGGGGGNSSSNSGAMTVLTHQNRLQPVAPSSTHDTYLGFTNPSASAFATATAKVSPSPSAHQHHPAPTSLPPLSSTSPLPSSNALSISPTYVSKARYVQPQPRTPLNAAVPSTSSGPVLVASVTVRGGIGGSHRGSVTGGGVAAAGGGGGSGDSVEMGTLGRGSSSMEDRMERGL